MFSVWNGTSFFLPALVGDVMDFPACIDRGFIKRKLTCVFSAPIASGFYMTCDKRLLTVDQCRVFNMGVSFFKNGLVCVSEVSICIATTVALRKDCVHQ